MAIKQEEILELLREQAGNDVVIQPIKVDFVKQSMKVLCSYPGRLFGRQKTILHELQDKSGWRIEIEAYAISVEELEKDLEDCESFRRLVPQQKGPDYYKVDVYFDKIPDKTFLADARCRRAGR